jgi:hypothetical protein
MSTKTRVFSVSAFEPVARPFSIIAHSKNQLARRLSDALELEPVLLEDTADALWKGRPVFMLDLALVLLPGRFNSVSYQMLSFQ